MFTTNAYCQEIPFKMIGGDIEWQQVYEEDLNIEPQTIFFTRPEKTTGIGIYIVFCEQADLYVDRKDGRTRLRVRNFQYRPPTLGGSGDLSRVATVAIKANKKEFRKSFVTRDAVHLDAMIKTTLDDLLGIGGDDW